VTIIVTSTALQVASATSISDERGEYRLSPLPIGTYIVLFELPGFQNIRREGVRLTVGVQRSSGRGDERGRRVRDDYGIRGVAVG
jgi:Carboxypeptidase regulatory-like domain